MAKYKAYPEYKDSGVEWLGMVPSHWNIKRLGQFFEERRDKVSDKDYPPLSVTMQGIVPQIDTAAKTDAGDNRKLVLKNDFVINSRSDRKGSSGVSQLIGSVSLISIVMEPKRINPKFAHHLLRSYPFQEEFYRYGKGIVADLWSTNSSEMKNILIPELADDESNAIACFLDHETAKIDNLIEKQQQLIELLKEKRQAVISHAVTKGLNPDVPMKDSGVEWLGDVPKHWKCGYLRWYISVSSGTYLNNKYFETDESNDCINPVIGGNGVMGFTSKINDENCLVVGRVGALCGNVHQIRRACWVTDNALKISYGCDFDVDYLEMYLKVLDLNKLANHNAQPLITGTMIKEQVAIIPSIDEQKNITKFIQSKVGKIDLLIQKSSEAVDKIKERRTALISAAVTGKIDVRDWVAPDTQNAEELQEATA